MARVTRPKTAHRHWPHRESGEEIRRSPPAGVWVRKQSFAYCEYYLQFAVRCADTYLYNHLDCLGIRGIHTTYSYITVLCTLLFLKVQNFQETWDCFIMFITVRFGGVLASNSSTSSNDWIWTNITLDIINYNNNNLSKTPQLSQNLIIF